MAIQADMLDSLLRDRIGKLEVQVKNLEEWAVHLEEENKILKEQIIKAMKAQKDDIENDVHEHVKKLVDQIQTLENEIKSIKQK
ncbi:MAG: hypothetical protein JSV09_03445 [Thermoplasmata archaeon]|nr:MAG: hypothetical protein JSV09_03445 [Thermoplasmata archaeon]